MSSCNDPDWIALKESVYRQNEEHEYAMAMENGLRESYRIRKSMNILVTGHKGMVGSSILSRLNAEHTVVGFDVVTHWEDWVERFDAFRSNLPNLDLIVHCGGLLDGHISDAGHRQELWQMNYLATEMLGSFAQDIGAKFLFFSSYTAFDPKTPYGWTKRTAEDVLRLNVPNDDLCIFRPTSIWSWDEAGKREPSSVYKIMSRQLSFVAKDCTRDFIYVADVADAACSVANRWVAGTFEIGAGTPVEIETLIRKIYGHLDISFEIPSIVDHSSLSGSRIVACPDRFPPNWKPIYPSVLTLDSQMADRIRVIEGAK